MTTSASPLTRDSLALMLTHILHLTDNNERRAVESQLIAALQHSDTLVELVHILCDQANIPVGTRHLAAVLLRKRIFSLWSALDATAQAEAQRLFIQQLGVEETKAVRFAIAHIVTRLAKADADNGGGGWPELQQAIRLAAEDPRVEMRELSMVLIYSFAEVYSEENALSDLAAESVVRGVVDSEDVVRKAAIKAGMMLLPCVHEKENLRRVFLEHLVPPCLDQLTALSTDKDKTSLCVAYLDLLDQCLIPLSSKKQGPLLLSLVAAVLQVLQNPAVNLLVRQNAGTLLSRVVEYKPKFSVAQGIFAQLVEAASQLMSEDETIGLPELDVVPDEDEENEMDDDDIDMLHVNTACMIGCQLLSSMAEHVTAKTYTGAVVPLIARLSDPLQTNDSPLGKKAAMLAMACLAESNPSYLRRRVGYVLELLAKYLQDAHPTPREAASASLSWFCSHLQPEILTHHHELFPLVVPLLLDSEDLVRRRAAQALDTLSEHVAENLEPYVPDLVNAVLQALPSSSLLTQKTMCCVLSSIAAAKCDSFFPLAPKVLELLMDAVKMTAPETVPLRARSTETVGVVGAAMGHDAFLPYFEFFMPPVMENLKSNDPLLREYSFGFLSNMCETLQQDFMPYVDYSINCAIATIEQDKATYTNKHLLKEGLGADFKFLVADDTPAAEDDDDDDDTAEIHMRVRTADVEEKSAAVYAIGVFANVLREAFGEERLKLCGDLLSSMDAHFSPNIRCNALVALAMLAKASHGSAEVLKVFDSDTLKTDTRTMVDDLMYQVLLPCIENESEKEVVGAALEALTNTLDFFGPQCLLFGPDDVVKVCVQILRVKLPCQRSGDDSDSEVDEENEADEALFEVPEAEEGSNPSWATTLNPDLVLANLRLPEDHDEEVMEQAVNVLESLFRCYGAGAAQYAPYVFPLLLRYADPATRPPEDLVMSVGTLACLLESMGPAAAPYFDMGFQVAAAVLEHSDESSAKSNAAYVLHVLVEKCTFRFVEDHGLLQQTLGMLWRVASQGEGEGDEEIPEAVDNAVSATCSLVRCLPPTALPLDSILSSLLLKIPMRIDKSENPNAVKTLIHVLTVLGEMASQAPWRPLLFAAVLRVLQSRSVEDSDKQQLASAGLSGFLHSYASAWVEAPAELQALMQQWSSQQ